MRVEWAVLCQRAQKSSNAGWDLESVGRSGVMIDAPVSEAGFIAFLCLRIDEADGVSASVEGRLRVFRPDGVELVRQEGELRWEGGTGPTLVTPERLYLPVELVFPLERGGVYRIEVWDGVSEWIVLPLYVSILGI